VFYIRPATSADLDSVLAAAAHLDSVNLPNDRRRLAVTLARSERSFAGALPVAEREYLFVAVERGDKSERVVGSSMIFAHHGTRQAPHIFFDVIDEERYSESLDRHFHHKVLRIGYSYTGLTEIGGLVLLPEYRRHPARLGRLLVHVRFLFMALHRSWFLDEVVSELMPPLEPDGTSLLWEALGRNFTDMSYQEADRLSRENKEFIRALFPQDPIYAALLPRKAQALIGQVGPHTKGVEALLLRAGFTYASRIDPFDGGPHFHARTDDLRPVRDTRRVRARIAAGALTADARDAVDALVARADGPFRALRGRVVLEGTEARLDPEAARLLELRDGDEVAVLPGG
jgi:arginine N-succinyltransferase